jgi:hypothetical protein
MYNVSGTIIGFEAKAVSKIGPNSCLYISRIDMEKRESGKYRESQNMILNFDLDCDLKKEFQGQITT